jgi:hypothetical protein
MHSLQFNTFRLISVGNNPVCAVPVQVESFS